MFFLKVVELASLDMRTTPLDKLTCLYDTVQQINNHIREALLATRSDGDDCDGPSKSLSNQLTNQPIN